MNRETFLNELMAGLTQLGPVEQRQVADYYNELIFDGVMVSPRRKSSQASARRRRSRRRFVPNTRASRLLRGRPGRARYRLVRHVWSIPLRSRCIP